MITIQPKKNVTMLIGTRFPFKIDGVAPVGYKPDVKRSVPCAVNHHDTVVDVLKTLALPTDGSMLLLEPGTIVPFDLDALPYADLKEGGKYEIVPNRADQVGPFAEIADQVNAESFAVSLLPPKAVPVPAAPVEEEVKEEKQEPPAKEEPPTI